MSTPPTVYLRADSHGGHIGRIRWANATADRYGCLWWDRIWPRRVLAAFNARLFIRPADPDTATPPVGVTGGGGVGSQA